MSVLKCYVVVLKRVFEMGSETVNKLILHDSTDNMVNKIPSRENGKTDQNHHHVQFSKKTELIPVNIIENHLKEHHIEEGEENIEKQEPETGLNSSEFNEQALRLASTKHNLKHTINPDSECCRQSDDSDSEMCHSKPRSILKHKPNCVVVVHQE